MAQPKGYALWTNSDGPNREHDTVTCSHCNTVIFLPHKAQNSNEMCGFCITCYRNICVNCVGRECTPFMKKVEMAEKKAAAIRTYGIK